MDELWKKLAVVAGYDPQSRQPQTTQQQITRTPQGIQTPAAAARAVPAIPQRRPTAPRVQNTMAILQQNLADQIRQQQAKNQQALQMYLQQGSGLTSPQLFAPPSLPLPANPGIDMDQNAYASYLYNRQHGFSDSGGAPFTFEQMYNIGQQRTLPQLNATLDPQGFYRPTLPQAPRYWEAPPLQVKKSSGRMIRRGKQPWINET